MSFIEINHFELLPFLCVSFLICSLEVVGNFNPLCYEIITWTWDLRAVNEVHLSRLGVSPLADWVPFDLEVFFLLEIIIIRLALRRQKRFLNLPSF